MKKNLQNKFNILWIIPTVIILSNLIIAIYGFATQTGTIGTLVGATAAFMTDPIIMLFSIIIGIFAPKTKLVHWVIIFLIIPVIFVLLMHFVFPTPYFIFDLFRFNSVMIIVSLVYLIKYKFSK